MRRSSHIAALGVASIALHCGAPSVELPDGGNGGSLLPDRMIEPPPGVPEFVPPPPVTPYPIVTINGTADGRRVFLEGPGINPTAAPLGASGAYCIDLVLPGPGTYTFTLRAYGQDNQIGMATQPIEVTYNPSAPDLQGVFTCDGVDPAGCEAAVEICDDGIDNDCNGLRDLQDPACQTCAPDQYEPNDDPSAPRIQPAQHSGLRLCPDDVDYFRLFVRDGERIEAQINFSHAEGNLDMDLIGVDLETVLVPARTDTDGERIVYTATVTGEHLLRVFGARGTANDYDLLVDIRQ